MRHVLLGLLKGSADALLAAPCRCSSVLLARLHGCWMRCGQAAAHFIFCGFMARVSMCGSHLHYGANLQSEAAATPHLLLRYFC